MFDSIYKSPFFAAFAYMVAFAVMVMYILFKNKRKQLITIGNINLYILFFTYFLMTPFQFTNEAWRSLSQYSATPFYPYLYKSISINFMGLTIFLLADMYFEKKLERKPLDTFLGHRLNSLIETSSRYAVNAALFCAASVVWLYIVYRYNGALPIFNQGRMFYFNEGFVSYVYQSLSIVISFYGLYFALYYLERKKGLFFVIIAIFLSFSTGNRSNLFIIILGPTLILIAYKRYKKVVFSKLIRLLPVLFALVVVGIAISLFRYGKQANGIDIFNSILYGSTFSDIRDGAYLFYGYENRLNGEFVGGKTYLAGLLSFVPSSFSPFRLEWSFGRYTANRMFGKTNHFGFRGGDAFEQYLNFRMPGVIILSILSAYFFATMETVSSEKIYKRMQNGEAASVNALFYIRVLSIISTFFMRSGVCRDLYTYLVLIVGIIMLHSILPLGKTDKQYKLVWRK